MCGRSRLWRGESCGVGGSAPSPPRSSSGWWVPSCWRLWRGLVGVTPRCTGSMSTVGRPMSSSRSGVRARRSWPPSRDTRYRRVVVLRTYALQPTNSPMQNLAIGAALNGTMNNAVDRPRLISGRFENPAVADQVDIGESLAHLADLRLGDTFDLVSWTPAQVAHILATNQFIGPAGPRIRLRIIGIVRRPLDLGERGRAGRCRRPARSVQHRVRQEDRYVRRSRGVRIRTVTPADIPTVTASAQQIFADVPNFEIQSLNIDTTGVGDAIHVLAIALFIFAAVTAIVGIAAIAIVLDRELSSSQPQQPTLLALGLSRRQRFAISTTRCDARRGRARSSPSPSPLCSHRCFRLALRRSSRPRPGISRRLGHARPRYRRHPCCGHRDRDRGRGSCRPARRATPAVPCESKLAARTLDLSRTAGLPVSTNAGLRMALDNGGGDRSVPVRSAFFATTFVAAGLTALIIFSAGVTHLAGTPSMYGSRFDFKVETTSDPACNSQDSGVGSMPGVATLAALCYDNVELDGRAGVGFGDLPLRGTVGPEVVSGHAPGTEREVALGAATLTALHKRVGDTITAQGPGGSATFRVRRGGRVPPARRPTARRRRRLVHPARLQHLARTARQPIQPELHPVSRRDLPTARIAPPSTPTSKGSRSIAPHPSRPRQPDRTSPSRSHDYAKPTGSRPHWQPCSHSSPSPPSATRSSPGPADGVASSQS